MVFFVNGFLNRNLLILLLYVEYEIFVTLIQFVLNFLKIKIKKKNVYRVVYIYFVYYFVQASRELLKLLNSIIYTVCIKVMPGQVQTI